MLEALGFFADLAENGTEVLAALEQTPYDLLFLDLRIPFKEGWETVQDIKTKVIDKQTVIIAMTANVSKETMQRCLSSGMDDFIAKPVRSEDIKQVIQKYVMKKGQC